MLPVRYYPESLSALSKATRFSEDEIKRMYRSFKSQCPTGFIQEDTFKDIYSQFFPFGGWLSNITAIKHYVHCSNIVGDKFQRHCSRRVKQTAENNKRLQCVSTILFYIIIEPFESVINSSASRRCDISHNKKMKQEKLRRNHFYEELMAKDLM